MMYEHYFQSDSSKVVAHKPVNLEISTLSAGLKRKFTLAIKTSEDKIKRRLNKTFPISEVYITSENDPIYMERAKQYAKQQQALAAAAADDGDDPSSSPPSAPQSRAQVAHRQEQLNYIGCKEIFTTHPGCGIVCIKMRAAEEQQQKKGDADSDASLDGFLYSVETKGGKSLGRQKQRYILLKRNCIYSLLLPSDILVTKVETRDKHGEIVPMKHWISSTAQLMPQKIPAPMQAFSNLMNNISPSLHNISPHNFAGLPSLPQLNNAFAHPNYASMVGHPMAMNVSNLSPFNMAASMSTGNSPARSINSTAQTPMATGAAAASVFNTLSPRGFFTMNTAVNTNSNTNNSGNTNTNTHGNSNVPGSPFNPMLMPKPSNGNMFASGSMSMNGVTFPSPTGQIMQNLNLMLPNSNGPSPNNSNAMMLLSNGSRMNSGQNSVIMSPAMLSPANSATTGANSSQPMMMNAQAIQQQIAHLQNMLAQQNKQNSSSNNSNSQQTPSARSMGGQAAAYQFGNASTPSSTFGGKNKFEFGTSTMTTATFNPLPNGLGLNSPQNAMNTFSPSNAAMNTEMNQSNVPMPNSASSTAPNLLSGFILASPSSQMEMSQQLRNQINGQIPHHHHSNSNSSLQTHGGNINQMGSKLEEPIQSPNSPTLPSNPRPIRGGVARDTNNGLYHSFESNPSAGPSVHTSTTSLPDTTRDNSAESSQAGSLRNSTESIANNLAGHNFFTQQQQQVHKPQRASAHMPLTTSSSSSNSSSSSQTQVKRESSDSAMAMNIASTPQHVNGNPMSSAYWNPPNPQPYAPPPSVAQSHASLPSVGSPDFLCADLFPPNNMQNAVSADFFASPLVENGSSDSSGSSNGSSPVLPINGGHSNVTDPSRRATYPSSSSLSAALKVPAQPVGLNGLLSPEPNRPSSQSSGSSRRSAANHKRKKTATKKKRKGGSTAGSIGEARKMYSLSPKLWNIENKKPPFRSTLTIGKHTDKFKSNDKIQIRFGGSFLDSSQIDQYKKHLLIDIPPPPSPAALMAQHQASGASSSSLDLSNTSIEVDLELHLNDQHVFSTVFTYKFGVAAHELTSSSEEEEDSESEDSSDEDSMEDSNTHGGASQGSPDQDDNNGGGRNSTSKRHKSWSASDHRYGGGSMGSQRATEGAVRLRANFESIPLFCTGVLKTYPLLNAGLQGLLHNYFLYSCMLQSESEPSESMHDQVVKKRFVVAKKSSGTSSSGESSSNEDHGMPSNNGGTNSPPRSSSAVPPSPSNRSPLRIRSGSSNSQVNARVQARLQFVQALTSANPLHFIYGALKACVVAAASNLKNAPANCPLEHASIHATDSFGFTLMHYAVAVGDVHSIERLLELGASPTLKAKTKNAQHAFSPMQLMQFRIAEETKTKRSESALSTRPASSIAHVVVDDNVNLSSKNKKRRTSLSNSGSNSNDSGSDDSSMSDATPSSSPVPVPGNTLSLNFSSLNSLGTSPAVSAQSSVASTPTGATARTLFKARGKNFNFADKEKSVLNTPQPHLNGDIQVYHMHQQPQQLAQYANLIASPTVTAAPTPRDNFSSPMPNGWNGHAASNGKGHISFPSTPVHGPRDSSAAREVAPMPAVASARNSPEPAEINEALSNLFKSYASQGTTTTDSASEMSDHNPHTVAQTTAPTVAEEPATTVSQLHISEKLESYLYFRWIQLQHKIAMTPQFSMSASIDPNSHTPVLALSEEVKANQRETVMLELALLIQHASKQMESLDIDLLEKQQPILVDPHAKLSAPLQSLHIHTLRTLLNQFHLLLKYYLPYQKHKFEQEQMKALVEEIDNVGFAADHKAKVSPHSASSHTANQIPTNANNTSSSNNQFLDVPSTPDQSAFDLHSPSFTDDAICALFVHVSAVELQLRAHILHMQKCLEPYITRALATRKVMKEKAKKAKIDATAEIVASIVNANYTPSNADSSPKTKTTALPAPLSASHVVRTHSGQLSLNIVGSWHPDEDDEHQRIEVREIHGVDLDGERRIDLQLSDKLVAEETIAEAERKNLRSVHQLQQEVKEAPLAEIVAKKVQEKVINANLLSTPKQRAPHGRQNSLSVAPFSTPAASPLANEVDGFPVPTTSVPANADVTSVVDSLSALSAAASSMSATSTNVAASSADGVATATGVTPVGNKYALLIGINHYSPALNIPALLGCENDVARIASIISEKYGFDVAQFRALDDGCSIPYVPGFRTQALLNSGATRLAIRRALISLKQAVTSPQDSVLLYFAGHGFSECLIAYEGMVDYSEITFLLEGLATRDVSFVSDTCASNTVETSHGANAQTTQVKNTSLTLEEMRSLVEKRDLHSQQAQAAQILATISPNAPGIMVTSNGGSGGSLAGYEGDEDRTSQAMDSSSDSREENTSNSDEEYDESSDEGEDDDDDEDMSDDVDSAPVVQKNYRGLAFCKTEPAEPSSCVVPPSPTSDEAPVIPVIQRLFARKGSKGVGYFARGLQSKADPRATEVCVDGKWHGTYTARLCEKLEKFSLESDMIPRASAEPANPPTISLAQILFHDEVGGNLSGREFSGNSSRCSSPRSTSYSMASSPNHSAAALAAALLADSFDVEYHMADEFNPSLHDDTACEAEEYSCLEDEPTQMERNPLQVEAQEVDNDGEEDILLDGDEPETEFEVGDECQFESDSPDMCEAAKEEASVLRTLTEEETELEADEEEEEYVDQAIPEDDVFVVPASASKRAAWLQAFVNMFMQLFLVVQLFRQDASVATPVKTQAETVSVVNTPVATPKKDLRLVTYESPAFSPAADILTTDMSSGDSSCCEQSPSHFNGLSSCSDAESSTPVKRMSFFSLGSQAPLSQSVESQ